MKNRLWIIVVALALALLLPAFSLAEARYPALRGPVTDDANVLSREVAGDIASFQTLVESRTGVTIHVAVVHFLDGVDVQTYASTLFTRWSLGENDFLLLGAVGEDIFASVSGKALKGKFSDSNAQSLLFTSGFGELFKGQSYDGAFSKYFVAFTDMLNKQYSADIRLGKLFAGYQTAAEAAPEPSSKGSKWDSFASDMWSGFQNDAAQNARSYGEYNERREREQGGLTPAGWIVLALLAALIFGKRTPGRGANGKPRYSGCGCSPLGWFFGILGFGVLRGKRKW